MLGIAVVAGVVTTAVALGTALVLGFGAYHVLEGTITLGQLTVLIAYVAAIYQPLESITNTIGHLNQQFVFLNAVLTLLDEQPEVVDDPDAIDIGRARGEIEFKDVCFAYKDRVDTLKDVSFKVEAGSRVAIVGPTGAGKTTLVNLLVRYYDPGSGTISIDGHDTKDITLDCLRRNLSLVLQQPQAFSGSIADNIRYGRLEATMEEIVAAAKSANCHDFIESLPEGYETELGEGGAQLSGGERQRICVARAFIRDAPILILDEPTSSIDSKTESVILDALETLMGGRTSFMIAHRLSTIRSADLIVVLNHGEVVEHGTHPELIARQGLYYQLYEAQTGRAARIESEYAIAQAEGKAPEEAAEIAMAAGAAAESEAADALAAMEAQPPQPEAAAAPATNGAPDKAPAPPATNGPPEPAPAPQANGANGAPDVTEKVIETLENAVRQRVRAALAARRDEQRQSGAAPMSAHHDAAQDANGADGNGAPGGTAPSTLPPGDDGGL